MAFGIAIAAYALGSFTTGYYLVRFCSGKDIRAFGSGNVGAKNVGRALGAWGFFATVLGDCGKGMLAVWIARHFSSDPLLISGAMLAVVAGHIWPVQLGFRGGKGVATSLGALLFYDYHLVAAFLLIFAAVFAFSRKTVLPGLFAFAALPFVAFYLNRDPVQTFNVLSLALVVLLTHRRNLHAEIAALAETESIKSEPKEHEL